MQAAFVTDLSEPGHTDSGVRRGGGGFGGQQNTSVTKTIDEGLAGHHGRTLVKASPEAQAPGEVTGRSRREGLEGEELTGRQRAKARAHSGP